MTRITIGQYYPTNSPIHRLDPRVKLLGTIFYITALLFVNHFAGYGLALIFIATLVKISKVPPRLLLRGLRAILFILVFASALNLFLTPGDTVIFQVGFIRLTMEGVAVAGKMVCRLVLLVLGSTILTLTTSPIQLTDGIEALLSPLKRIKVPAHDIAMMMSIALRFIPTLADETEKIIKAQKARGADFDTGGLITRAKSLIPILVPLFISAFKRADELATAMEARCYRGDINRTKMKQMKIAPSDILATAILISFCVAIILTRFI
ncbi:MAG: energy-coupling factor transporter transmembrane protein EcfT [Defluviitaleaceae bacterium]|nr:energy-coupling factor transporter transmembrane protein EcfT [Defluviitaleaceae bacterium]MCL2263383.1 energy-coupling factor transporter transmembrane protein EcfT [Defluviitaleaceae bacterium]